ncbi:hypothetical protein M5K25_015108 [Dendrobium thyrsiflorum]|uniref:Uncharacterized protein n=1 Tax=Dendrobium thyrsiflorum TaxID=117978 RepID=A0ABD0UPH6_DENTH
MYEKMESSSPFVRFPLLRTLVESNYRACTIPYRFPSDYLRKATAVEIQWIGLFLNSVPSFRVNAMECVGLHLFFRKISVVLSFCLLLFKTSLIVSLIRASHRLFTPFFTLPIIPVHQRAENDSTVTNAPAKAEKFAQRKCQSHRINLLNLCKTPNIRVMKEHKFLLILPQYKTGNLCQRLQWQHSLAGVPMLSKGWLHCSLAHLHIHRSPSCHHMCLPP